MGFLSLEFRNLNDLLVQQLHDLYDAEQHLTEALPKMAEAATSPELRNAFDRPPRPDERASRRGSNTFQSNG